VLTDPQASAGCQTGSNLDWWVNWDVCCDCGRVVRTTHRGETGARSDICLSPPRVRQRPNQLAVQAEQLVTRYTVSLLLVLLVLLILAYACGSRAGVGAISTTYVLPAAVQTAAITQEPVVTSATALPTPAQVPTIGPALVSTEGSFTVGSLRVCGEQGHRCVRDAPVRVLVLLCDRRSSGRGRTWLVMTQRRLR